MTDDEHRALAAKVAKEYPGPWATHDWPQYYDAPDTWIGPLDPSPHMPPGNVKSMAGTFSDVGDDVASYLAACSPDRIERLYAELEELRGRP